VVGGRETSTPDTSTPVENGKRKGRDRKVAAVAEHDDGYEEAEEEEEKEEDGQMEVNLLTEMPLGNPNVSYGKWHRWSPLSFINLYTDENYTEIQHQLPATRRKKCWRMQRRLK